MSDFIYLKRTKKSRGRMWCDYNNLMTWFLDWVIGFAEIIDGLIAILSLGFLGSSCAYCIAMYKLRFMQTKD